MFQKDVIRTLILFLFFSEVPILALTYLVVRKCSFRNGGGWRRAASAYVRIAERPIAAIMLCGALGFVLAAAVAVAHWPVPRVQDEFSYLLGADTFAHGRLTNPPSPVWAHFETEHVLQQPTYASKYPPGQGLILAIGESLFGLPIVGVWLSVGLASAAVCWMLQAWTPPGWAMLAGLLTASDPMMLGWWADGYWGGYGALIGGALVFGGVRRVVGSTFRPGLRATDEILAAIGLIVLGATRPYEGLAASIPAGLLLGAWLLRRRAAPSRVFGRVLAPLLVVLILGVCAMAWYNKQVTGDPLMMPYQLHSAQYSATPLFLWQDAPPHHEYRDRKLQDFYAGWEAEAFRRQQTPLNIVKNSVHRMGMYLGFYLGPIFSIALIGLFLPRRSGALTPEDRRIDPWICFGAASISACLGAALLTVWKNPHYIAPVGCMFVFLSVEGLRRLRIVTTGRHAAAAIIASRVPMLAITIAAVALIYPTNDWSHARANINSRLLAMGGKHLVILRHGRYFEPHQEWVYNDADLENSPVVWARELDTRSTGDLLDHYPDRTPWLLNAYRSDPRHGEFIPTLVPYPRAPAWLYSEPVRPGSSAAVIGAAAADLSGNGNTDLVLLEHGARAANLLIADGHGSYTTQILSLPGTPSAVVCVDIDGDGLIDVVTAVGRQVLVLKNRGHAELEAPRSIDAGGTINAMCAADFDGDGRTDLALSIVDPSGVRVLFNTGSDLFTPGQILGAGTAPGAIVAEDFNGDGRPDLAVADAGSSSVRVFINALGGARDASPGFTAAASISVGAGPMGITAADLNGDGVIDIATANSGDDTATVLLNDGRAGFTRKDYEVGVFPVSIVSADLNGDGATDLIVGTRLANGLTVLKGLGKGIFAPPADITLGSQTWFAEKSWCALVADLDKDGTQDVVIGGARGLDIILSSRSTPGAPLRSPQHPNSDRLGN